MKDSPLSEQPNTDTRTFAFGDFRTEFPEQSHNIRPLNISRYWMRKDRLKRFEVSSFHPFFSTTSWYQRQLSRPFACSR